MSEQPAPDPKESLNLVILYRAEANEYSIAAHNKNANEANQLIDDYTTHLQPGCSLLKIEQRKQHAAEAENCRACRETVTRSSGLSPAPKFTRRKS